MASNSAPANKSPRRAKTAGDRLRRLLAIVPWIVSNPGVEVSAVAKRFGLSEAELIDDLNVVWMVGLPPYTPDALVEVAMEDGKVWIHYADFFARPLRLSSAQGLALLASTDGLLSIPGSEADGPLARALGKLASALGVDPGEVVDVELGVVEADLLAQLRDAAEAGTEVEIDYYSYGRDEHSTRTIAPWRVRSTDGAWYVEAWCHKAADERVFRIDRIESLVVTGMGSDHRPNNPDADPTLGSTFHPNQGDPTVTLRLQSSARWVTEAYPCQLLAEHGDGSLDVSMVITALPWLERLMIRLGPAATMIDGGALEGAAALQSEAAKRVLTRYTTAGS